MQLRLAVVVALALVFSAAGCVPIVRAAQPACDPAPADADVNALTSDMHVLAELQRHNTDTIEFSTKDVIKIVQNCHRLLIAPYEMLAVDGGNAVERYIAVFEQPSENSFISDLRKSEHLKRKHFALAGVYPVGTWGMIDWRRAVVSDGQVSVPAVSLLCVKYRCCNGGPSLVLINVSTEDGQVVTSVKNEYNGSDDSSRCP